MFASAQQYRSRNIHTFATDWAHTSWTAGILESLDFLHPGRSRHTNEELAGKKLPRWWCTARWSRSKWICVQSRKQDSSSTQRAAGDSSPSSSSTSSLSSSPYLLRFPKTKTPCSPSFMIAAVCGLMIVIYYSQNIQNCCTSDTRMSFRSPTDRRRRIHSWSRLESYSEPGFRTQDYHTHPHPQSQSPFSSSLSSVKCQKCFVPFAFGSLGFIVMLFVRAGKTLPRVRLNERKEGGMLRKRSLNNTPQPQDHLIGVLGLLYPLTHMGSIWFQRYIYFFLHNFLHIHV